MNVKLADMIENFDELTKAAKDLAIEKNIEKEAEEIEDIKEEKELEIDETPEIVEAPIVEGEVIGEEVVEKPVDEAPEVEGDQKILVEDPDVAVGSEEDAVKTIKAKDVEDNEKPFKDADKKEDDKDKKDDKKDGKKDKKDSKNKDNKEDDEDEKEAKKEDAKKSTEMVSLEDLEGLLKSILNTFKSSVENDEAISKSLDSLNKRIDTVTEKLENTSESIEDTAKSIDTAISLGEDGLEVVEKGVTYVAKSDENSQVADTTIPEETNEVATSEEENVDVVAEPTFDADAQREIFLKRYQEEAGNQRMGRSNYTLSAIYDLRNDFLDAREGMELSEDRQQRLKDFVDKK